MYMDLMSTLSSFRCRRKGRSSQAAPAFFGEACDFLPYFVRLGNLRSSSFLSVLFSLCAYWRPRSLRLRGFVVLLLVAWTFSGAPCSLWERKRKPIVLTTYEFSHFFINMAKKYCEQYAAEGHLEIEYKNENTYFFCATGLQENLLESIGTGTFINEIRVGG